jgi:hypothetical protein
MAAHRALGARGCGPIFTRRFTRQSSLPRGSNFGLGTVSNYGGLGKTPAGTEGDNRTGYQQRKKGEPGTSGALVCQSFIVKD